jgi:hypothetical protein
MEIISSHRQLRTHTTCLEEIAACVDRARRAEADHDAWKAAGTYDRYMAYFESESSDAEMSRQMERKNDTHD